MRARNGIFVVISQTIIAFMAEKRSVSMSSSNSELREREQEASPVLHKKRMIKCNYKSKCSKE